MSEPTPDLLRVAEACEEAAITVERRAYALHSKLSCDTHDSFHGDVIRREAAAADVRALHQTLQVLRAHARAIREGRVTVREEGQHATAD